jgi:hypothetical protein
MTVRTWWELTCNVDHGWYVTRWQRRGILAATVVVEYGPLALPEIYDVLDCDVTAALWDAVAIELSSS